MLIKIATDVARSKAIWFGPLSESSPKIYTLEASRIIKVNNGKKARKNDISLFNLIIYLF